MATIYRKTDKGHDEIATRAHRLAPRLRTALIMVDGKRGDADLRALIGPQTEETLGELHEGGFIEVVALLDTGRSELRPSSRSVSTGAGGDSVPPATASRSTTAPAFETVRRDAVRALNDLLGPMGETLSMKMEKAGSAEALRPLIEVASQIIRNARGAQAAADFAKKFNDKLGA